MVGFEHAQLSKETVNRISAALRGHYGDAYVARAHHCIRSNQGASPAIKLVLGEDLMQKIDPAKHASLVQGYLWDFKESVFNAIVRLVDRLGESAAMRLAQVPDFLPELQRRANDIAVSTSNNRTFKSAVRYVSANVERFWSYLVDLMTGSREDITLGADDTSALEQGGSQAGYLKKAIRELSRYVIYAKRVGTGILRVVTALMSYLGKAVGDALSAFNAMAQVVVEDVPTWVSEKADVAKRRAVGYFFFLLAAVDEMHTAIQAGVKDLTDRLNRMLSALARRISMVVDYFLELSAVKALRATWNRIVSLPLLQPLVRAVNAVGTGLSVLAQTLGKMAWAVDMMISYAYGGPQVLFNYIYAAAMPMCTRLISDTITTCIGGKTADKIGALLDTKGIDETVTLAKRLVNLPGDILSRAQNKNIREAIASYASMKEFIVESVETKQQQKTGTRIASMFKSARNNGRMLTALYYKDDLDPGLLNDITLGRVNMSVRVAQDQLAATAENLSAQVDLALVELGVDSVNASTREYTRLEDDDAFYSQLGDLRDGAESLVGGRVVRSKPVPQRGTRNDRVVPPPVARTDIEKLTEMWKSVYGDTYIPTTVVGLEEASEVIRDEIAGLRSIERQSPSEIEAAENAIDALLSTARSPENGKTSRRKLREQFELLKQKRAALNDALIETIDRRKEKQGLKDAIDRYNRREMTKYVRDSVLSIMTLATVASLGVFAWGYFSARRKQAAETARLAAIANNLDIEINTDLRYSMFTENAAAQALERDFASERGAPLNPTDLGDIQAYQTWARARISSVTGGALTIARAQQAYIAERARLLQQPQGLLGRVADYFRSNSKISISDVSTVASTSARSDDDDSNEMSFDPTDLPGAITRLESAYTGFLPMGSRSQRWDDDDDPIAYLQNARADLLAQVNSVSATAARAVADLGEARKAADAARVGSATAAYMKAGWRAVTNTYQAAMYGKSDEDFARILTGDATVEELLRFARNEKAISYIANVAKIATSLIGGIVASVLIVIGVIITAIVEHRRGGNVFDAAFVGKTLLGLISSFGLIWQPIMSIINTAVSDNSSMMWTSLKKYLTVIRITAGIIAAVSTGGLSVAVALASATARWAASSFYRVSGKSLAGSKAKANAAEEARRSNFMMRTFDTTVFEARAGVDEQEDEVATAVAPAARRRRRKKEPRTGRKAMAVPGKSPLERLKAVKTITVTQI